jgi:uncharacterized membrane protein
LTLAALLVAFGLRQYQLGAESLWYDETVSVYLARLPLPAMLAHTAGDIHPPLYYALLHAWGALTAPSLAHGLEFLFAFPSLWFGVLILPLLYALGRRLFGPRTGLAALWLGAVAPFLVWYSQEVRMYTLGAFLGLLALWALLQFWGLGRRAVAAADGVPHAASTPAVPHARRRWAWLAVYVAAAAAGLYTLYYFLFLLVALNLIALLALVALVAGRDAPPGNAAATPRTSLRPAIAWLAAQGAVLLLWLPWLPVFWRQATDPPVPPWRTPWPSAAAFLGSLSETLAALVVGQTPPGGLVWPWAVVAALLLVGLGVLAVARTARCTTGAARTRLWLALAAVLLYVFVPVAILYTATLLGAPIYHVRYLALFAPLFLLVPAWLVVNAARLRPALGAALWLALLGVSAASLFTFWTNPLYRADDHRSAVAALAVQWRPGDAILANAGWIYPILTTYWPGGMAGASGGELGVESSAGSAPPPLEPPVRLIDYTQMASSPTLATPLVVRSGSVDGPPSLGWGDPASDFFAIGPGETTAALGALAQDARRLWHYRLYDTVSDPTGLIRTWLATNTLPTAETPIPGRDYGLVQLFTTPRGAPEPVPAGTPLATFGGAVELSAAAAPPTATAGSYLYVDLLWHALPPLADLPADLSLSLRLYDAAGQAVAQADGPLHDLPARTWDPALSYPQVAALPLSSNLAPGTYTLGAIVYRQDNAEALPVTAGGAGDQGAQSQESAQMWTLAAIEVAPR